MFSLLRNRFGVPGLISVIALVFAMSGGAFAAKDHLGSATDSAKKENRKGKKVIITKLNQIKPNVRRALRGNRGPAGAPGSPGIPGAQGIPGAPGANGADGKDGESGKDGKSVVVGSFSGEEEPAGEPCNGQGGTEVEVEGSGEVFYVCNGEPGPITGSLPGGVTLTGVWDVAAFGAAGTIETRSASFGLALEAAPTAKFVAPGEEGVEGCPGSAAEPKAEGGFFCAYAEELAGASHFDLGFPKSRKSGVVLAFVIEEAEALGFGTWAVTAP